MSAFSAFTNDVSAPTTCVASASESVTRAAESRRAAGYPRFRLKPSAMTRACNTARSVLGVLRGV
jgi:hypothetical protein